MKAESLLIDIQSSEAKSYYGNMKPKKAYDGDYSTFYSVKDHDTSDNYLKLFLDGVYAISSVNVTNRLDGFFNRFAGTLVMVTTTDMKKFGASKTISVVSCGNPLPGEEVYNIRY